jgi:hypothetical protein
MYYEEYVGPWSYDELASCPYCDGRGLVSDESDCCPHFVVAFQRGVWDHSLCPPVWCNGFQYSLDDLKDDLRTVSSNVDVMCRAKPGTQRHPEIEAFFCADPEVVHELRAKHRKIPAIRPGNSCPECGHSATVIGEMDDLACAMCGATCGFCEIARTPFGSTEQT